MVQPKEDPIHDWSMLRLFLYYKRFIIGQTAAESNDPSNRYITTKTGVNSNSSPLTKTTKNNLRRIYSLFHFLLNQTVYIFAALFYSCTFVVSVLVPRWEVKLQLKLRLFDYPSVHFRSLTCSKINHWCYIVKDRICF